MKKLLIILLSMMVLISITSVIYFNFSKLVVNLNSVDVCELENDTWLDANISNDTLKKRIVENPEGYYFASVNASIINNKKIKYNRWRIFGSNKYDGKQIYLPQGEPECSSSSIVESNSTLENVGFNIILYYENGTLEDVKKFLLEEVDVYAVGYPVLF